MRSFIRNEFFNFIAKIMKDEEGVYEEYTTTSLE